MLKKIKTIYNLHSSGRYNSFIRMLTSIWMDSFIHLAVFRRLLFGTVFRHPVHHTPISDESKDVYGSANPAYNRSSIIYNNVVGPNLLLIPLKNVLIRLLKHLLGLFMLRLSKYQKLCQSVKRKLPNFKSN